MAEPYLLSPSGQRDLDDIWLYIAKDNPAAADRAEGELIAAMRKIGEYPLWGHTREDLTGKNVRFWGIHSYMIIYDPAARPVHILRILSGFRDIGPVLGDEPS